MLRGDINMSYLYSEVGLLLLNAVQIVPTPPVPSNGGPFPHISPEIQSK